MYLLKLDGNNSPFAIVADGENINDRIALAIKEEISADEVIAPTQNFKVILDWGEEHYFNVKYTEDGDAEFDDISVMITKIIIY